MSEMAPSRSSRMPRAQRRRSIVAAYANAALWGVGNGLASTTLILYLIRQQQASGLAVSWILAAPSLVGLLRLATPAWLERVRSRRVFCVGMFLASSTVLAALPLVSADSVMAAGRTRLLAISAAWAGYQLLEHIGVVALWSWLGDLTPSRVRGRFLGRREAWMNVGGVAGTVLAVAVTYAWPEFAAKSDPPNFGVYRVWQSYAACGLAGAVALAAAALVLLRMNDAPRTAIRRPARVHLRDLAAPLVDARFRPLMAFGLWFSFSNGIIQTAQSIFPLGPLGISFGVKKTLDGGLRAAKAAVLPVVGATVDRRGNVRMLAVAQAIIATAPLFFLFATPAAPWWILGVYACWLAYAGHEVAMPNLMLGLSEPGKTATYAAAWFAWTQLAFALSTLAGGALFDWLSAAAPPMALGGRPVDFYAVMFAASWALKAFGVVLATRIPEPTRNG